MINVGATVTKKAENVLFVAIPASAAEMKITQHGMEIALLRQLKLLVKIDMIVFHQKKV